MSIDINYMKLGEKRILLQSCTSSNTHTQQLIREGKAENGMVVVCREQTEGRGQTSSKWFVEPGKNLTFSMVIFPSFFSVTEAFYLNIFTSLSLFDYLVLQLGNRIKIKWPNDILADNHKIAGILIENTLTDSSITNTVIGIGLNVNQVYFNESFKATSMKCVSGNEYEINDVLNGLLKHLNHRYLQLTSSEHDALKQDYLRNLYLYHEPARFKTSEGIIEGTILGINPDGKLAIHSDDSIQYYNLKEIEYCN